MPPKSNKKAPKKAPKKNPTIEQARNALKIKGTKSSYPTSQAYMEALRSNKIKQELVLNQNLKRTSSSTSSSAKKPKTEPKKTEPKKTAPKKTAPRKTAPRKTAPTEGIGTRW